MPAYENEPNGPFPIRFRVKAICQPRIKWRVVEEFGVESLTEMEDGRLLFQAGYSDKENLLSWIPVSYTHLSSPGIAVPGKSWP